MERHGSSKNDGCSSSAVVRESAWIASRMWSRSAAEIRGSRAGVSLTAQIQATPKQPQMAELTQKTAAQPRLEAISADDAVATIFPAFCPA